MDLVFMEKQTECFMFDWVTEIGTKPNLSLGPVAHKGERQARTFTPQEMNTSSEYAPGLQNQIKTPEGPLLNP